ATNIFPVFIPGTCQYVAPSPANFSCSSSAQDTRVQTIRNVCSFDPRYFIPSGASCLNANCQIAMVEFANCCQQQRLFQHQSCCSNKQDILTFLTKCKVNIAARLCQTINTTSILFNNSAPVTVPSAP